MSYPELLITLTAKENNANNVTIAFTMGLKALEKGHKVALVLLSDAVHLAKKGYADSIDIGAPFKPIKEVLPAFLANGGQLKVCSACLEHNGIPVDDNLLSGIEIINAEDVVDLVMNAGKTLQLNG